MNTAPFWVMVGSFLLSFQVAAGEASKPRVAVLDLKAQGVTADTAATLTGVFLSGLSEGGQIDLVGKSDMACILTLEETNNLLGCTTEDPHCAVEHGHGLGNAILVWGSVGQVGNRVVISVAAVDLQAEKTLGRASRSVHADDGKEMIEATTELASEIRAALGLSSRATWKPNLAVMAHFGVSVSDYSAANGSMDPFNWRFEAELDWFVLQELPLFLKVGACTGFTGRPASTDSGQTANSYGAWALPVSVGAKYRFIGPVLTPYLELGIGASLLQLKDLAGAFNLQALAGLELTPWKQFGFVFEGGFIFSQFFAAGSQNYVQVGGEITVGGLYRF